MTLTDTVRTAATKKAPALQGMSMLYLGYSRRVS